MSRFRVGLNPLPWVFDGKAMDLSEPNLRAAFTEIQQTPFRGIHADPGDLPPVRYAALLAEHGLDPAPGYIAGRFADDDPSSIVETARRLAGIQAELGNREVFLADATAPVRRQTPARGAGSDPGRLRQIIEHIGAAAEAITAEGVRPALHPHVGTWIETETEIEALLAAVPSGILGFGPDTGHLYWAGMDPAAVIARHADRVAAMHLKDVRAAEVTAARTAEADYVASTRGPHQVWTEPGRGDVALRAAVDALPTDFTGWVIVEVDVPAVATALESTLISGRWITEHYGPDAY